MLYHSRFTEPHKVLKENKLLRLLGRKAWRRGCQHGVAILTQIGEISVNISADLMISDLCPLDRLAQRAGRLSRFEERKGGKRHVVGELYVVMPHRINKNGEAVFYPAPYGHHEQGKGWIPVPALLKTDELLREGEYSATTFVDRVNQLYPSATKPEQRARDNKRAFVNCIVGNWLILPAIEVDQDDDHVEEQWKSRDIPPQYTVYADYDIWFDNETTYFDNRSRQREFEMRHGLQCYAWEFKQAKDNGWIESVTFRVREEEAPIYLVRSQFYSNETGLLFNDENED
jgi:CRISPR-associated endonuclease/helicase Cas3